MKLLRKMNVGTRIFVNVAALFALMLSVLIMGIVVSIDITRTQQENITVVSQQGELIEMASQDFQRLLLNANRILGMGNAQVSVDETNQLFTSYNNALLGYKELALASEYNTLTEDFFTELEATSLEFHNLYMQLVRTGTLSQPMRFTQVAETLLAKVGEMSEAAKYSLEMHAEVTEQMLTRLGILEVVFYLLAIIIGLIISSRVIKSIVKPLRDLEAGLKEIAEGNMDIVINTEYEDELGELSKSTSVVVSKFKHIIEQMNEVSKEVIDNGDIDARIDASMYKGDFASIVDAYNNTVDILTNQTLEVLGAIGTIAEGDFNIHIKKYPGKSAFINTNLDLFIDNLQDISNKITLLVESAAYGQFDKPIDVDIYSGVWKEIMLGLNTLLIKSTQPINEVVSVLKEIENGNLSQRVQGDYKGEYALIKNSLNATADKISLYIDEVSNILTEISNKNLDVEVQGQYVGDFSILKDSLTKIIDNFNTMFINMKEASIEMVSDFKSTSESTQQLVGIAKDQFSSSEVLVEISNQLSKQYENNKEYLNETNKVVADTKESAESSNTHLGNTRKNIKEMEDSSGQIMNIIAVIDNIAFQTNLLALNAAVEAARAGQHGKGFAVVAEEVRNLAARSKNAAQDTTNLLREDSQIVASVSEVIGQIVENFKSINDQIADISEHIVNITEFTNRDLENMNKMKSEVEKVAYISQLNASVSEKEIELIDKLAVRIENLNKAVESFNLKENKFRGASRTNRKTNNNTEKEVTVSNKNETSKGAASKKEVVKNETSKSAANKKEVVKNETSKSTANKKEVVKNEISKSAANKKEVIKNETSKSTVSRKELVKSETKAVANKTSIGKQEYVDFSSNGFGKY